MHQRKHFRLFRNDFVFFLLAVFQSQLDCHIFFSWFSVARAEDGFVYKALLFLLSRLHAFAIQRRQVNHTLPSSIVRITFLL